MQANINRQLSEVGCEICGRQSGKHTDFTTTSSGFLSPYHSTNALYYQGSATYCKRAKCDTWNDFKWYAE